MISRSGIALPVVLLGAALFAPSAPAQVRGMHASAPAARGRSSFRFNGRNRFVRPVHRRFYDGSFFYPDYAYDSGYEATTPEASPEQVVPAQPAEPPMRVASPGLILEERDGQWVRIPTGGQLPVSPQPASLDSARARNLQANIGEPKEAPQLLAELPPAVLVFRDGHKEEIKKYMIQGDVLYASADYWSTGSWTRKILLAELNVPASLKLNAERGAKFNLPTGPNEIVVRF